MEEAVSVAVRVRPLGGQEKAVGSAWKITGPQEISLALDGKGGNNSGGQGGGGAETGSSNKPYLLGKRTRIFSPRSYRNGLEIDEVL